jgi:type IX secretion system PorP/SprF family membrane protein
VSAGAGAMYESTNLDVESLYWGKDVKPEDDPVYNKLINGANKHGELWTRTGLLVYSDNFYIGGTYYPWSTSINSSDLAFNEAFYKAGVQAGFSLQLNEDYVVKPSVWALMQVDNAFVIDYNLKFYLEQKAWMGLTYRDIKAGIVSAGFNINEKLSVSYSYEFALGKLRTFGGGSHELILASRLKNFRKFNQRVW